MKAQALAPVALITLLALVLASPATLTVTLSHFPIDFTRFYVYTSTGTLAAEGTVTGNQFSFEYDSATSYIAKVEGDKAVAIFTIPRGLTTDYTFDVRQAANITITVTFKGPGFKPSSVTYTIVVDNYLNLTATTGKQLYAQPPVTLLFPESIYFPAVYGYKLVNVTVDGAAAATINTVGAHTVEVTYEAAGLATIEPLYLMAGAGIIAVLVAFLLTRRSGVQSAVVALRSPYLER